MKKLIFIIFIFIIGCSSLKEKEDRVKKSIQWNIQGLHTELVSISECDAFQDLRSVEYCKQLSIAIIKKHYDEIALGIWYLPINERKKLGFDIDYIKGYILMHLYFVGIKDVEL